MTTELAKLQARIEKLERDARHQRRWSATWLGTFLATVLCGGVYLQAAPKPRQVAAPRDETLRDVTVRSLRVVGSDGKARALLSSDADGGFLHLRDEKGPRVSLQIFNGEGTIQTFGMLGKELVSLESGAEGGGIVLSDVTGTNLVFMGIDPGGGILSLRGRDEKPRLVLHNLVGGSGGVLSVRGNDGVERAVLGTDSDGGLLGLAGNDGKNRVLASVMAGGGSLALNDNALRTRVLSLVAETGGRVAVVDEKGDVEGKIPSQTK